MKCIFKIGIIVVTFASSLEMHSQRPLDRDPQNIVDPTGFMKVLTLPPKVEGSANMFEDWQLGDIYLSHGKYARDVTFNYDVLNHLLAIMVDSNEFSLKLLAVDSVILINTHQTLVNAMLLKGLSGDALLLKLCDSQNLTLFRKVVVEVIKPNYNELLDVGSRNFIVDQDYLYLLRDKNKNQFYQLKGKKKDFKALAHGDKLTDYIKDKNFDLKNESDLIAIIKYYEQLIY